MLAVFLSVSVSHCSLDSSRSVYLTTKPTYVSRTQYTDVPSNPLRGLCVFCCHGAYLEAQTCPQPSYTEVGGVARLLLLGNPWFSNPSCLRYPELQRGTVGSWSFFPRSLSALCLSRAAGGGADFALLQVSSLLSCGWSQITEIAQ